MNERLLPFLIHMWFPLIFCSFFLNFAWWLWKECAALRETQLSKRYNKKTCCHERIYFISIYYRLLRIYWLYEYYKLSLISQGFDILQGVPTSLGNAKCNVLKLRKVCEQSQLLLQNIDPIKRGNFEFWPSYIIKITYFPLFVESFCKPKSQTFLSFRTLHLAYPKLVGTPCSWNSLKTVSNSWHSYLKCKETAEFP